MPPSCSSDVTTPTVGDCKEAHRDSAQPGSLSLSSSRTAPSIHVRAALTWLAIFPLVAIGLTAMAPFTVGLGPGAPRVRADTCHGLLPVIPMKMRCHLSTAHPRGPQRQAPANNIPEPPAIAGDVLSAEEHNRSRRTPGRRGHLSITGANYRSQGGTIGGVVAVWSPLMWPGLELPAGWPAPGAGRVRTGP